MIFNAITFEHLQTDCQAMRRLRACDSSLKDLGAASIRPCSADRIGHVRAGTSRSPGLWTTEPESSELLCYRDRVICREASGLVVWRSRWDLNGSRRPQEGNTGVPYSTELCPFVSRTSPVRREREQESIPRHSAFIPITTGILPLYYKIVPWASDGGLRRHSETNFSAIVLTVLYEKRYTVRRIIASFDDAFFAENIERNCIMRLKILKEIVT